MITPVRLLKFENSCIKKLPENSGSLYINPAPSPILAKPPWGKGWERERLPITETETHIEWPYVKASFIH